MSLPTSSTKEVKSEEELALEGRREKRARLLAEQHRRDQAACNAALDRVLRALHALKMKKKAPPAAANPPEPASTPREPRARKTFALKRPPSSELKSPDPAKRALLEKEAENDIEIVYETPKADPNKTSAGTLPTGVPTLASANPTPSSNNNPNKLPYPASLSAQPQCSNSPSTSSLQLKTVETAVPQKRPRHSSSVPNYYAATFEDISPPSSPAFRPLPVEPVENRINAISDMVQSYAGTPHSVVSPSSRYWNAGETPQLPTPLPRTQPPPSAPSPFALCMDPISAWPSPASLPAQPNIALQQPLAAGLQLPLQQPQLGYQQQQQPQPGYYQQQQQPQPGYQQQQQPQPGYQQQQQPQPGYQQQQQPQPGYQQQQKPQPGYQQQQQPQPGYQQQQQPQPGYQQQQQPQLSLPQHCPSNFSTLQPSCPPSCSQQSDLDAQGRWGRQSERGRPRGSRIYRYTRYLKAVSEYLWRLSWQERSLWFRLHHLDMAEDMYPNEIERRLKVHLERVASRLEWLKALHRCVYCRSHFPSLKICSVREHWSQCPAKFLRGANEAAENIQRETIEDAWYRLARSAFPTPLGPTPLHI